jgi:hypothetical protein
MRERIKFEPGSDSVTLENSVVRGHRDEYVFRARPGQQLTVHISSIEDNAAFEIHFHESGENIEYVGTSQPRQWNGQPRRRWSGELPPLGGSYAFVDYAIVVRGSPRNATYKLTVTIK